MPIMAWNSSLATGIASIDAQHQQLVQYVNELYDAMTQNRGKEATGKVLGELVSYTVKHFAHEEQYFAKTGYPDSAAHIVEHEKLKAQVGDFGKKFAAGQATVNAELMNFLRTWLMTHIMGSDKKYAPHLKAKGAV
ncbi:MAG TPA: bacteriohemerythrin [Planctomycetes bacterium]|nr:bacteriohemerythrin [Planctomycetota bacterium]